jgi:hypothetical protein
MPPRTIGTSLTARICLITSRAVGHDIDVHPIPTN